MAYAVKKGGGKTLLCYADADYANEDDRKSTSGFILNVSGNPVNWTTKRQTCVSLSSTEAEFTLATGASELLWMIQLLTDIGIKVTQPAKILRTKNCVSTYLEDGRIVDSNMLT